ncbi:MAG: hypothetical protein ACK52H_02890 [Burkholderiales bacterium]|jgi:hypothetical protein|uniref:hypothetical protein n=1 Tax=Limnohabitans sp. TaxID=1907725 RepID=UPI0037BFD51E
MDAFEQARQKEFEKFQSAIGSESDPTMLVLRAHLFSENLLERLLNFKLPRGDKVIESGNLSYHQKIVLVDALDCIPDSIVSSLRNLNKLRNQCAHELDKKITDGDVTRVGSPLGKNFTRFKRDANFDDAILLRNVIDYVCGFLTAICHHSEHTDLASTKSSKTKSVKEKAGITRRSTGATQKAAQPG